MMVPSLRSRRINRGGGREFGQKKTIFTFNDLLVLVLYLQKGLAMKCWSKTQNSTRKDRPSKAKRNTGMRSTIKTSETVNCFTNNLPKCL